MDLSELAEFALLNVAILVLSAKWGIVEAYQLYRPKWLPSSCNFCLFFWLSLVEYLALVHMGFEAIVFALCGAVLSCYLYANIVRL
jgi:hypothetical protein